MYIGTCIRGGTNASRDWRRWLIALAGLTVAFGLWGSTERGVKDTRSARARAKIFPTIDIAPDGKSLVFVGNGSGGSDLYRYTFATRKVTPLVQTSEQEIDPTFSPDGRYIAYSSGERDFDEDGWIHPRHIYVRDLHTGKVRPITDNPDRWDYEPRFSSDGSYITLHDAARDTRTRYPGDVWIADVARAKSRQISREGYTMALRPVFWRGDAEVLFTADKNRETEEAWYLVSVPRDGSGAPTPITPPGIHSSSAQVIDARTLLLMSDLDGKLGHTICLYDLETRVFDVLADVPTGPASPVFHGRTVYFLRGRGDLMRVSLDTRRLERVETWKMLAYPERYYGKEGDRRVL